MYVVSSHAHRKDNDTRTRTDLELLVLRVLRTFDLAVEVVSTVASDVERERVAGGQDGRFVRSREVGRGGGRLPVGGIG